MCTGPSDVSEQTVLPSPFLCSCFVPSVAYTAVGSIRAHQTANSALFACCTSRLTCVSSRFMGVLPPDLVILTVSPSTSRARHCNCVPVESESSSLSCTGMPLGHSGQPCSSKNTSQRNSCSLCRQFCRNPSPPTSGRPSHRCSPPEATYVLLPSSTASILAPAAATSCSRPPCLQLAAPTCVASGKHFRICMRHSVLPNGSLFFLCRCSRPTSLCTASPSTVLTGAAV